MRSYTGWVPVVGSLNTLQCERNILTSEFDFCYDLQTKSSLQSRTGRTLHDFGDEWGWMRNRSLPIFKKNIHWDVPRKTKERCSIQMWKHGPKLVCIIKFMVYSGSKRLAMSIPDLFGDVPKLGEWVVSVHLHKKLSCISVPLLLFPRWCRKNQTRLLPPPPKIWS